jgi:hypothetical protein
MITITDTGLVDCNSTNSLINITAVSDRPIIPRPLTYNIMVTVTGTVTVTELLFQ